MAALTNIEEITAARALYAGQNSCFATLFWTTTDHGRRFDSNLRKPYSLIDCRQIRSALIILRQVHGHHKLEDYIRCHHMLR